MHRSASSIADHIPDDTYGNLIRSMFPPGIIFFYILLYIWNILAKE